MLSLKSLMERFECPITGSLMIDPVIAADGETYERWTIERWMSLNSNPTSPLHRMPFAHHILTPNRLIKRMIDEQFSEEKTEESKSSTDASNLPTQSNPRNLKLLRIKNTEELNQQPWWQEQEQLWNLATVSTHENSVQELRHSLVIRGQIPAGRFRLAIQRNNVELAKLLMYRGAKEFYIDDYRSALRNNHGDFSLAILLLNNIVLDDNTIQLLYTAIANDGNAAILDELIALAPLNDVTLHSAIEAAIAAGNFMTLNVLLSYAVIPKSRISAETLWEKMISGLSSTNIGLLSVFFNQQIPITNYSNLLTRVLSCATMNDMSVLTSLLLKKNQNEVVALSSEQSKAALDRLGLSALILLLTNGIAMNADIHHQVIEHCAIKNNEFKTNIAKLQSDIQLYCDGERYQDYDKEKLMRRRSIALMLMGLLTYAIGFSLDKSNIPTIVIGTVLIALAWLSRWQPSHDECFVAFGCLPSSEYMEFDDKRLPLKIEINELNNARAVLARQTTLTITTLVENNQRPQADDLHYAHQATALPQEVLHAIERAVVNRLSTTNWSTFWDRPSDIEEGVRLNFCNYSRPSGA